MKSLKLMKEVHVCKFYDITGENYIGEKRVSFNTERFNFNNQEYFFIPKKSTILHTERLIRVTKYYFYNEGNPEPILLKKDYKPSMTSRDFNTFINSVKMEELNNLKKKNSFWDFITNPKFFIPLMVVIGLVYWYYHKQGKI
jgi:hypothetical protein